MVNLRPDHLEIVKRILAERVPEYQVRAFGSRARWTAKDTSDLDLVVMTDAPLDLARLADLQEAFSESDLPFRVDVLDWAATGVEFREIIEQDDAVIQQPGSTGSSGPTWGRLDMPIEEVTFAEILSDIVDNRGKTCPTADIGIPLIATNCIRNDLLYPAYKKIRYVSQETYDTWFRGHPKPGDLIFVNKGTPGRVCIAPDPVDFCIAQDMVAVRADPKKVYPKYLFALLRSPMIQTRIEQMHVGTLIPHFKKGDFDKLLLPILDRDAQRFIGDTYFELSAKIDLNRRMNQTLEGMARAIFKSWFVDFNPVRAKAAGRQPPGLAPHIADLFPDAFETSELGEIPKGWQIKPLDRIAHYQNGLALQKYPPEDDEYLPVIKIRELRQGRPDNRSGKASPNIKSSCVVEDGDVVFSWSGSLLVDLWCGGRGALNQHLFKVTSKRYPKWFYYYWTKHHLGEFRRIAAGKATTMGHIKRSHLNSALTHVPPDELLRTADKAIGSVIDRIIVNSLESRTLAALRDTLLPKLISGELRVPDAERFLTEVSS